MSNSPRISRRNSVGRTFTNNTIREAYPYLLEDFKGRCAYSMQHVQTIGDVAMNIDHFDPRKKRKKRQAYSNLNLASSQCNISKSNNWPTRQQRLSGARFLNPCKEKDYGVHIFEDPTTHELVGRTVAGNYQILMCNLNAQHFVLERTERTALAKILLEFGKIKSDSATVQQSISQLRQSYARKIPPIPPPTTGHGPQAT